MRCDSFALLSFQLSHIGPYFYLQAPAPDELMNVVHFNCKQSSKNQCGSNLRSCLKNALSCASACCGCCRTGCYNGTLDIEENVFDDDIENYDNLFKKFRRGGHI